MDSLAYAVVSTLGPASASPPAARRLLDAGATAFRINTSHVEPPALARWLDELHPVLADAPLYLDLQGSKWRVGEIADMILAPGSLIEMVCPPAGVPGGGVPVPHPDFFRAAALCDGRVLVDDARIELRVERAFPDRLTATVLRGGTLRRRKGLTVPVSSFRRESLTAADAQIVELTRSLASIRYALSYVRDGSEMDRYRQLLPPGADLTAKIERPSAVEEAADIARHCQRLWLCRGDLGAELGSRAMAETVHAFSASLPAMPVPVLLAGQVLEHMTSNPAPTRSEICHLYDMLRSGYAGVVLSDETAVGRYPEESVRAAATWRSDSPHPPSSTQRLR